jgi:hypothetical protein
LPPKDESSNIPDSVQETAYPNTLDCSESLQDHNILSKGMRSHKSPYCLSYKTLKPVVSD